MQVNKQVVETVSLLSGIILCDIDAMALSLYDNTLLYQKSHALDHLPVIDAQSDQDAKMKYLIDSLNFIDGKNELVPWILDHPIEPGEDLDEFLPPVLLQKLSGTRLSFFRIIALNAFALGQCLMQMGSKKHSYHMFVCTIQIYERILRCPQSDKLKSDSEACRAVYKLLVEMTLEFHDYDSALEYSTKLVALNDAALAQVMMKYQPAELSLDSLDICSSPLESSPLDETLQALSEPDDLTEATLTIDEQEWVNLDLESHFDAQMLLVKASKAAENRNVLVHAYVRALELIKLCDEQHQAHWIRDPIKMQIDLCLSLIEANDNAKSDALISVQHARLANELERQWQQESNPNKDSNTDSIPDVDAVGSNPKDDSRDAIQPFESNQEEEIVQIVDQVALRFKICFLAGKSLYRYALQLAGGLEHASSPPIAVRKSSDVPSIKMILEESLMHLEDAQRWTTADATGPITQRTIALQVTLIDLACCYPD